MLAAVQPMMKSMTPPSIIQMKESSDIIGSNARKRRRLILSNRATKTTTPPTASIVTTKIFPRFSSMGTPSLVTNPSKVSTGNLHQVVKNVVKNTKLPQNCTSLYECSVKEKETKPHPQKLKFKVSKPIDAEIVQPQVTVQSQEDKESTQKACTKKKPQMRYDPSVPMTKEAAAVWRREQRRKRNRDSAAASRQRQRNRISELEEEVVEWKVKYNEAMARIAKQESDLKDLMQRRNNSMTNNSEGSFGCMPTTIENTSGINNISFSDACCPVSPCPSPILSHVLPSDISSLPYSQVPPVVGDVRDSNAHDGIKVEEDEQQFSPRNVVSKKARNLIEISRPV